VALTSPWTYTTTDYQGNVLSVMITFDNTLFTILGITTHKDAGCMYNNFYFGLGADGTPNTSTSQLAIAQGDSIAAVLTLNGFGFTTIQQALAGQTTAGP